MRNNIINVKTPEKFTEEINALVGNEYSILEEYISWNKKIKFIHNLNQCGHEFKMTPNNFLNGGRCPKCSFIERTLKNPRRKSHDDFVRQVQESRGDIFIFHSQYINAKTGIDVECKRCGMRYFANVRNLLKKVNGCNHCSRISEKTVKPQISKYKYTTEEFRNIVQELTNNEYDVIGSFKGVKIKILFKHISCGNLYEVTPDHFLTGTRCPKCFGNTKKTTDDYKNDVYNIAKDEYKVIGEYKTARTKILMQHNISTCKNIFKTTPDSFLRGSGCPVCSESKGEKKIRAWLEKHYFIFDSQYNKFIDLISDFGNPLRFDFAIFEDQEKTILKLLIEYDGEFHYKKYYEEQNFETTQHHDSLKNIYCSNNSIRLLRIPYWEFENIDKILNKELLYVK